MHRLIRVSNFGMVAGRINVIAANFINNLGRDYVMEPSLEYKPEFAYWFVEMLPNIPDAINIVNSLEKSFLDYKGKLIFYSLADHAHSNYDFLKKTILNRVDAWLVNSVFPNNQKKREQYICNEIIHKYVQLPKYNIFSPVSVGEISENKENKIFFVGYSHQRDNRIIPVKILRSDEYLTKKFVGGVFSTEPTESWIFHDRYDSYFDFFNEMKKYKLAFCPPGNSVYCVRHLEAIACKMACISLDLETNEDEDWMYKDMINYYIYKYIPDLSNFKDICYYALNNESETDYRANKLYEIYKTFFELNPDFSYKAHTWIPIQFQLNKLGILV